MKTTHSISKPNRDAKGRYKAGQRGSQVLRDVAKAFGYAGLVIVGLVLALYNLNAYLWRFRLYKRLFIAVQATCLLIIMYAVNVSVTHRDPLMLSEVDMDLSPIEIINLEDRMIHPQKAEAKVLGASDKDEVIEAIERHFGKYSGQAIACFKSESGLRPTAFNGKNRNHTFDAGLAQINQIHCSKIGKSGNSCKEALFDVETNLTVARKIFDARGWNAWYGSGCRQFWK